MKHKLFWASLLIAVSVGLLFLSGCASRRAMNKLFFDLGRAQGKIEVMK